MKPEIAAAFFFGSLWGSFFHTLALRYISGELQVTPGRALFSLSRCPRCGSAINPLYMVPVLGYFLSRTRCRHCHGKISPTYPAFEVLHGLTAAWAASNGGISPLSVSAYFVLACALTSAWIDISTMIMPDFLSAAILAFSIYPAAASDSFADSFTGLGFMAGVFIVILLIFPGSFGGGDLKFGAACGLFLGFEMSVVMLEAALITGSIGGIAYAIATRKGFRTRMPFGPYLAAGLFAAHFYGGDILLLYFRIID